MVALLFLVLFHASLIAISWIHWDTACERPLPVFLLCAGALGVLAAVLYAALELQQRHRNESMLPTEMEPIPQRWLKALVMLAILSAVILVGVGTALYRAAPLCATTSPIVHTWTLATLLLYTAFGSLVVGVPLLGFLFPLFSMALVPVIASLVAVSAWLSDAGKRGAHSAASVLSRWLQAGSADSSAAQPQAPTIINPASTFGLYVNTAALVWLFGFMIIEVYRSWELPCDQPLRAYVLGVGSLGVAIALIDFVGEVFKVRACLQAAHAHSNSRCALPSSWFTLCFPPDAVFHPRIQCHP